MDFKPCVFGHCVLSWPTETDDRIHDVFLGTGAALVAGFPSMIDQENCDSPATQIQNPRLRFVFLARTTECGVLSNTIMSTPFRSGSIMACPLDADKSGMAHSCKSGVMSESFFSTCGEKGMTNGFAWKLRVFFRPHRAFFWVWARTS